jgi:hypothetical protein
MLSVSIFNFNINRLANIKYAIEAIFTSISAIVYNTSDLQASNQNHPRAGVAYRHKQHHQGVTPRITI